MNNRYESLTEASKVAATRCNMWDIFTGDEEYDSESLIGIAQIHDSEAPVDEGDFYVVSQGGAIGLAEDGENIEWLFIPINSTEELPEVVGQESSAKFCAECGASVTPDAIFCGSCGSKL